MSALLSRIVFITSVRVVTMMNIQQQQTQDAWDTIAVGYDEFVTPTHRHVSKAALDIAGLREGMRFLDVAAGTGALSLPAAQLSADVVATDISPAMVDSA